MRRLALPTCVLTMLVLIGLAPAASPPPRSRSAHWSFHPPRRPPVPALPSPFQSFQPVDAFLLARLRDKGLEFAPPADRATLLRRLTHDLTGLPPTPEEMDAFLADARPDAYERVVDRLLASPHHGERWAQHWLDVVRFAETNGYELDGERPHAWRYRDWVVDSFNRDLPYDQFLLAQLAGDLLVAAQPGRSDLLIAAGFNRCGPIHQVSGNIDPLEVRQELHNEMMAGLGASFLGLTLTCARCHDHKFDPISMEEYYRLEAFFSAAKPKDVDLASMAERAAHARDAALLQARILPLRKQVGQIEEPYRKKIRQEKHDKLEPGLREALAIESSRRSPEQRKRAVEAEILLKVTWDEVVAALSDADRKRRSDLRRQIHDLEAGSPPPAAQAWSLAEANEPLASPVLKRGNIHRSGPKVTPGFPGFLGQSSAPTPNNRLGLANWLLHKDHPLTARVIVNRLWQHHFGRGLVTSPNDFGLRGERPSHPDLLDWLAVELRESGWSLKHLHRLMVTSRAYQQSSHPSPDAKNKDPDNRLLSRMNRRRLEGESLRDTMLSVSGQLTPWLAGPKIRVPLEPEVYDLIFSEDEPDGLWPITPDPRQHLRRSLYLFAKRNVRQPLLEAFDQPDMLSPCAARQVSTFAPQALILLNGPFAQQMAQAFASRLLHERRTGPEEQIDLGYRLALGRAPSQVERESALRFLGEQEQLLRKKQERGEPVALPGGLPPGTDPARGAALADFCLALLNRNAFVYLD